MVHVYSKSKQIMVTLASCLWLPRLNVRKQLDPTTGKATNQPEVFDPKNPKSKELIESFRDRGYDPQYPVVVGDITDAYIKEGLQLRNEEWQLLKAAQKQAPSPETMARLVAFEFFYVKKDAKGKEHLIAPEYLGCTGNRRSRCVFEAAVERLIIASKDPKNDTFNKPENFLQGMEIYALHEHFETEDDRTLRQIAENTAKLEGFKQLNHLEILYGVKDGVETGRIKQARLREDFKDGEGQRIYGFLTLNARFPNLKLFERLTYDDKHPDAIIWSKLPQGGKGGFPEVVRRSNKLTNDDWNRKLLEKNPNATIEPFMSEADVAQAFRDWRKGKQGNEPRMMEKTALQSLQASSPVKVINELMADVLTNKKEAIDKYTAIAPTLNAVHALLGKPEFNGLSEIVTNVASVADDKVRAEMVEYLGKVAKVFPNEKVRQKVLHAVSGK